MTVSIVAYIFFGEICDIQEAVVAGQKPYHFLLCEIKTS
jgi:hypothetical protein